MLEGVPRGDWRATRLRCRDAPGQPRPTCVGRRKSRHRLRGFSLLPPAVFCSCSAPYVVGRPIRCATWTVYSSRTMARPRGVVSHCGVSIRLVLFISAVAVLASACESLSSRPGRDVGALGGWRPPTPLRGTVVERTAVIFRDIDSVRVGQRQMDGGAVAVRIGFETTAGSMGSAVPVAADGYFLTAGHVVRPLASSLTLVANTRERGTLRAVKTAARVVWPPEGVALSEASDIAVVHADLPPLVPFDIATVDDLRSGSRILATGWNPLLDTASEEPTAGRGPRPITGSRFASAGRILAIGATRGSTVPDDPRFRVIRHDAPVGPGDSGGGIVDAHGRLIGVNVRTRVSASSAASRRTPTGPFSR